MEQGNPSFSDRGVGPEGELCCLRLKCSFAEGHADYLLILIDLKIECTSHDFLIACTAIQVQNGYENYKLD